MSDLLSIYIDRLALGKSENIEVILPFDFLQADDEDVRFCAPISVKGEAYVADDHLILRLSLGTQFSTKCAICNGACEVQISLEHFYQTVPLAKIPSAVFNFGDLVRDALLLEIPHSSECGGGSCQEREGLKKYFSNGDSNVRPFEDL